MSDLNPIIQIVDADVDVPGKTSAEMDQKIKDILELHRDIFLSEGNALPPPAHVVVCYLKVGPLSEADCPTGVSASPRVLTKVYKLLKRLLKTA